MKHRVKRIAVSLLITAMVPTMSNGAESKDERLMFKETVVSAPVAEVWHAWTTAEGLSFASKKSNVELRVGGAYEWFLDGPLDERGRRGAEGSHILAYLPEKMLAFAWTFPPDTPELRYNDQHTQVVVLFDDVDGYTTHVQLHVIGWQAGDDWDRGWAYFDSAWRYVLDALTSHFEDNNA